MYRQCINFCDVWRFNDQECPRCLKDMPWVDLVRLGEFRRVLRVLFGWNHTWVAKFKEIIPNDYLSVLKEGPKTVGMAVPGRPQTTKQSTASRSCDVPSKGVVIGDLTMGGKVTFASHCIDTPSWLLRPVKGMHRTQLPSCAGCYEVKGWIFEFTPLLS